MKSFKSGWRDCQEQEESNIALCLVIGLVVTSILWYSVHSYLVERGEINRFLNLIA